MNRAAGGRAENFHYHRYVSPPLAQQYALLPLVHHLCMWRKVIMAWRISWKYEYTKIFTIVRHFNYRLKRVASSLNSTLNATFTYNNIFCHGLQAMVWNNLQLLSWSLQCESSIFLPNIHNSKSFWNTRANASSLEHSDGWKLDLCVVAITAFVTFNGWSRPHRRTLNKGYHLYT